MGVSEFFSNSPANQEEETWEYLFGYGLKSTVFNYHASYTFSKYIEALHLNNLSVTLPIVENRDILDEELLAKALDHHSIVTSQLPDTQEYYIQTADEIIEELDRMIFEDTVDPELDLALFDPESCADYGSSYVFKPEIVLGQMSLNQLNLLIDEIESCIRQYSTFLVNELATRDELDYEQELKETFFSRLHEVIARQNFLQNCGSVSPESRARYLELPPECETSGNKLKFIDLLGSNQFGAKSALVSATEALRRSWRRMRRHMENSRSSSLSKNNHHSGVFTLAGKKVMQRTSSAVNYFRRLTLPIKPHEISAAQKLTSSNSTIDLPSHSELNFTDWRKSSNNFSPQFGSFSAAATPTDGHSSRHSAFSLNNNTLLKHKDDKNLKILSTRIPYHESATAEGPTVGHLELFNEFLHCMLSNNENLTTLLTDYILNVYAPGEKSTPRLII